MTDMSGVSVREGMSSTASTLRPSNFVGETGSLGVSVRTGELGTLTFNTPFEFHSPPSSTVDEPISPAAPALGDPLLLFAIDAARRSCNVILPAAPTFLFCPSFFAAARAASRATNLALANGGSTFGRRIFQDAVEVLFYFLHCLLEESSPCGPR